MRHKTKMILGGVAILGLAGLGYYYVTQQKTAAVVPSNPQLSPGTPVSTLTPGQKYLIAATLPSGLCPEAVQGWPCSAADTKSLTDALTAAGWGSVAVQAMGGQTASTVLGVTMPAGGYVATGVWTGAKNASIPPGVVVVTAA